MPGGGVSTGDILLGSVPERMCGEQEPSPVAGYSVPTAGVQAARARLPRAACRATRLLHCQQHHTS